MQQIAQFGWFWHGGWQVANYFRIFVRMDVPPVLRSLIAFIDQQKPAFFSKQEWWYHVLMMLILFPIGNYYFIGAQYFRKPVMFVTGTVLVLGLYWLSIVVLTMAVRWVIRLLPDVRQASIRILAMLLVVSGITTGLAVFDVWLYSLVPATGVSFSWAIVQPIWVLGYVFDVFLCIALSVFYTYTQWHDRQAENEQLKRAALQHQFDALKGQLNPHFLFNSLNSLSSLIGEDPVRAERFVDDMAKVYRYLLQAGTREWVTLQAELDFITTYADLLRTRYGDSLRIERQVASHHTTRSLPPLTIQTLVDNAMKYNVMLASRPLTIRIETTITGQLQVSNNMQRKTIRLATSREGLTSLVAKFRLLGTDEPQIYQDDSQFIVTLPLLDRDVA